LLLFFARISTTRADPIRAATSLIPKAISRAVVRLGDDGCDRGMAQEQKRATGADAGLDTVVDRGERLSA